MEYQELDDLKRIKKDYGEKMSHMCRELFPSILEKPGFLYHLLSSNFVKSKSLYDDIVNENKKLAFKEYIFYFFDKENRRANRKPTKRVKDLLDEAGYLFFECKTNEDIRKFKKYYVSKEKLCTFKDPYRIEHYYIFFIVRKDVDKINRDDFKNPKREDLYSTSVLDLQFDKGEKQRVSIKSRYNHTVTNPDATYSNNLDRIVPGLTDAFEYEYDFNIGGEYKSDFWLTNYVKDNNNRFIKYNYEINNIYYCINNIILDGHNVINNYTNKSRYTFMDYFILDEKEKKILVYDKYIKDSFVDELKEIKDIKITNKDKYKEIILTLKDNKDVLIKLDSKGRIIGYYNKYLEECENDFLTYNTELEELYLPNLSSCKNFFLSDNEKLKELILPKLVTCGNFFLFKNKIIDKIELQKLTTCCDGFLCQNKNLKAINLPNLVSCGDDFLSNNYSISDLNLQNIEKVGNRFLVENKSLQKLYLPKLTKCGYSFLTYNMSIKEIYLPNLIECNNGFLSSNNNINRINMNNLPKQYYLFLSALIARLIKENKNRSLLEYKDDEEKVFDKNNGLKIIKKKEY